MWHLLGCIVAFSLIPETHSRRTAAGPGVDFVPLREAAQGLNTKVGAASPLSLLSPGANASYQQRFVTNYDLTTAENACKWEQTEPQQGVFSLDACSKVRDFAVNHSMAFRGHNLCWDRENPAWLDQLQPDDKRDALRTHVTRLISHFGDSAIAWDVVNEAIADGLVTELDEPALQYETKLKDAVTNFPEQNLLQTGYTKQNPWGFKRSVWWPDVPDYVWVAFSAARAAAPSSVKLFYNDYAIGNADSPKAKRVYALVKNLTEAGLIDGVGLQMHVSNGWEKNNLPGLQASMKQYAALGLEVHITEMDVKNPTNNDATQAATYASALGCCLNSTACTNFETWGFTDLHTWIGTSLRPLPFDTHLQPKQAALQMSSLLASAPRG